MKYSLKYLKNSKVLWIIITAFVTLLLDNFLGKPINYLIDKYIFNKKEVSYEILNISKLPKNKLSNYTKVEPISEFNLSLDDPILTDYYVYKVRISNKGKSILNDLTIKIKFNGRYVKILDIKNKVISPKNKEIFLTTSLPDLYWSMEEVKSFGGPGALNWDNPTDNNETFVGYQVYRSRFKEVGYGKISDKLIKENRYYMFDSPVVFSHPYYYALEAITKSGRRSDINIFEVSSLQIIPFMAFFKNVSYIVPQEIDNVTSRQQLKRPQYRTLKEAIKDGYSNTYVIKAYKKNYNISDKFFDNNENPYRLYYKDDLTFLDGNTSLKIINGLDEGAEVNLYILCKILPVDKINISVSLEGQPDIKYYEKSSKIQYDVNVQDNSASYDKTKYSLMPKMVNLYYGKKSIYLIWAKPNNINYTGVRIFKIELKSETTENALGQEIYDGGGDVGELMCKYIYRTDPVNKENIFYDMPPKKLTKTKMPMTPKFMGISDTQATNVVDNVNSPYIKDDKIYPNKKYKYTIYTYDINGNYSYPIEVILDTNDDFIAPYCP